MEKIAIIYWSGSGNTQKMAESIQEGALTTGADVILKEVCDADVSDIADADIVFLGCPSMGSEELESDEFLPYFNDIKESLKDKKLGLFGSYGWGDGEWMNNWYDECLELGAQLLADGLIVNSYPSDTDILTCIEFGKLK